MDPATNSQTVDVRVPHSLGKLEARRRLEAGLGKAKSAAGAVAKVDERWTGDRMNFSLSVMGQSLTGWADVADDAVTVNVVLPALLAKLAGGLKDKLRPQIEAKTREALQLPKQ